MALTIGNHVPDNAYPSSSADCTSRADSTVRTETFMEVTIDNYGRIVIPKPLRERLGLDPGAALQLTVEPADGGEALQLRPVNDRLTLVRKDGVLVHTGTTANETFDPVESVRRARAERTRHLADPDAS
jgi:AbrB family looped-hinge helix DNA binding protein